MEAKVIKAFYDMQDPKRTIYQVGAIYEGAEKRISELESKGFVQAEHKADEPKKELKQAAKKVAKKSK